MDSEVDFVDFWDLGVPNSEAGASVISRRAAWISAGVSNVAGLTAAIKNIKLRAEDFFDFKFYLYQLVYERHYI